jgi:drug/metabolite transporter (DMT)-like permease
VNISSYAFYLVIAKPMMAKYKPLTVMKWVFNFGFIFIFPFCFEQALSTDFAAIPTTVWFSILFVVVGVTILAYFFNVYALQYVSPVVNSSYIYSQPAIAAITSYIILNEQLTIVKIVSALMIFMGVYFVSIRKAKTMS